MKTHPILFSGDMVQAILKGRKTQTRRIIKPQPEDNEKIDGCHWTGTGWSTWYKNAGCQCRPIKCPYGQPSDLLWVRETFRSNKKYFAGYRADGSCGVFFQNGAGSRYFLKHGQMVGGGCPPKDGTQYGIRKYGDCWKSSIHMPRWANRITLEIKDIRVERLQDISEEDAEAEGVKWFNSGGVECPGMPKTPLEAFKQIWSEINGAESWNKNPWVWAVEFSTHLCNIDEYMKRAA